MGIGDGQMGIVVPGSDSLSRDCELVQYDDGTFENGFAWHIDYVVPPDTSSIGVQFTDIDGRVCEFIFF